MTLAPATRLGPYEIVAPLGAGGMGEVYRARDTRLGREVAVKVLPADVANDADRLRRFEQEARATSAIQHANLLVLFDIGNESGVAFLVTELLVGETLREAMQHGPVPARRAIEIAVQVARGLAAAHEVGIVHRDLKPENLFVTRDGTAKILDFGLAKVELSELAGKNLQDVSTVLETSAGTVLGTVGYMAPEQVRGERADARSDLFSLGVVLHELLGGANPFRRGSVIESLNAILKEEPAELDAGAGATTPALARIVARLLEKDPDRRFRSAADLAFALEGLASLSSGAGRVAAQRELPTGRISRRLRLAAAASLALAAMATAFWLGQRRAVPAPLAATVRFEIPAPESTTFAVNSVETVQLAVSPDGRKVAFIGLRTPAGAVEGWSIWLRSIDDLHARPVDGTEGATSLTWSPDGESISFFRRDKLLRIGAGGGTAVPICDVPSGIGYAASWGRNGEILFSSVQGDAIYRVPASGGVAEAHVRADPATGLIRVSWPYWLPDGKGFLFFARSSSEKTTLMLVEGDRPPREIGPLASRVELVAPDWLLFAQEGALYAQRFDRGGGALVGSRVAIAPAVRYFYSSAWAGFAASANGTIAYLTGENVGRLLWFGRDGEQLGSVGEPGSHLNLAISPDGGSVLYDRQHPELGTYDLWQSDLARGVEVRLTSRPDADFSGVWFPDGKRIVYSTVHTRTPNLVLRDLITGSEEVLTPRETFQVAHGISRDGRLLAYSERDEGRFEARLLSLDPERADQDLFAQDASEGQVRFSPDGDYVAFLSDISGSMEAYVAPLVAPNASVRISKNGGRLVRWSRDGRELFVVSEGNELLTYPVRTTPTVEVGEPRLLFRLPGDGNWTDFDVTPDSSRFLASVRERSGGRDPISVVTGWSPPRTGQPEN